LSTHSPLAGDAQISLKRAKCKGSFILFADACSFAQNAERERERSHTRDFASHNQNFTKISILLANITIFIFYQIYFNKCAAKIFISYLY
jgi:hypothetical protein